MKKLLLVILILLVVAWAATLLLIPNPLTISAVTAIKAPATKVNTYILTDSLWHKWRPMVHKADLYNYTIQSKTPYSAHIFGQANKDTFSSELLVLPASPDSALAQWTAVLPNAGLNPFTRWTRYKRAVAIKEEFQLFLNSLTTYLQDRKKVYGMDITITNFTNPFMLNNQTVLDHSPTTSEVYGAVEKLRKFALAGKAVAIDSPMVNMEQTDNTFLLRTALPIDKKLDATHDIDFKQMVLGKTLLATVTGGRQQVIQSLQSMREFISDYRLSSPAIPFQVWQTNRQQQPDSSKWITRLYYPIF